MGNVNELKDFTRGQIDAALMKIGHDVGMGTKEAIEAFLRDELVVSRPARVWKTWMTIKLGTFKNVDEIRKALKAGKHSIGDWTKDILGRPAFTVSKTEQEVELINISVEELGFKQHTCYSDICKRAFELGFDLCPAEVGPQLRLQYKNQPAAKCVVVAMNAIATGDRLGVFIVGSYNGGDYYLDVDYGSAERAWYTDDRFVFLRRKTD